MNTAGETALERREMDFPRPGGGDDALGIAGGDAAPRHDDNPVGRAADESAISGSPSSSLLAGGEHAVDAEPDQRLQRFEGFGSHVERPVKRHR